MSRFDTMNYDRETSVSRVKQCIEDYPDESMLVTLAAGFAVGLVIGGLLASPADSRHWRNRQAAAGLGERLMASIEKVLPDSVSSSLGMHR